MSRLRSLSGEWRDAVRAERGIGISRSRRRSPLPILFIATFLAGMAVRQAWPESQGENEKRTLHPPAPVAGDSFRLETNRRLEALEAKFKPHSGLPAVLPDEGTLRWVEAHK